MGTHPMRTSFRKAAKLVTFVKVKTFHSEFARSIVHNSLTSVLLSRFLIFVKNSSVATNWDRSNSVFFRVHRITDNSYLHIFEHKPEYYIQLSYTFEGDKNSNQLFQQKKWIQSVQGKVIYSVSRILHLTSNQKVLSRW